MFSIASKLWDIPRTHSVAPNQKNKDFFFTEDKTEPLGATGAATVHPYLRYIALIFFTFLSHVFFGINLHRSGGVSLPM